MSIAKEINETRYYLSNRSKENHARHLLENCKEHRVRQVNKMVIFRWTRFYDVVNSETLHMRAFDTEQEAINFCLDFYENTKKGVQQNLFNEIEKQ